MLNWFLICLTFFLPILTYPIKKKTRTSLEVIKNKFDSLSLREKAEEPERIVVPKTSLDLAIRTSGISGNTWSTYREGATYGFGSSFINSDKGSTVIFAHAKKGLFLDINKLDKGDKVYVLSNDTWYTLEVAEKFKVKPNQISFLRSFGKRVVLVTCNGENDEYRLVVSLEGKGSGGKKIA